MFKSKSMRVPYVEYYNTPFLCSKLVYPIVRARRHTNPTATKPKRNNPGEEDLPVYASLAFGSSPVPHVQENGRLSRRHHGEAQGSDFYRPSTSCDLPAPKRPIQYSPDKLSQHLSRFPILSFRVKRLTKKRRRENACTIVTDMLTDRGTRGDDDNDDDDDDKGQV
ncbi:hypothetical protein P153DRAFT_397129 [Dothidotthia symphoricarpi CBS 119687]|uniref:Uncharacterized protein n=1 Tax=Dothidotthia symphoricarpi CBS 119687 TaxID=1392245 RepID=A0A6A6AAW0_9PLEO|nr:uncharacterized protein P153DRAFT_397129 [Dothidotthia symphoricarpi CBS 119687]KAF2128909.1 hypothetical protein P153DRAFT_397129 [Dothidotthia symphoricarpi CBS 119687]